MPRRLVADAFGVLTISLVSLFAVLGLFCIYRCIYFWLRICKPEFLQLGFFNGPRIIRLFLIITALWWCFGEVLRLSFLKGTGRPFTNLQWQKDLCKFYIISNLGFAEPSIILTLVLLLHASLQRPQSGALTQNWNMKTIAYILIFCLPMLILHLGVIFFGPKLDNMVKNEERTKLTKYLTSAHSFHEQNDVCTYPLLSAAFLGLFNALIVTYVLFAGARLLSSVINKRLRWQIYWLIASIFLFLPFRVVLIGFSAFLHPGNLIQETITFLAFCTMLSCITVGVYMLVYRPVTDCLALGDIQLVEMSEIPYDDYYHDSGSVIALHMPATTRRATPMPLRSGDQFPSEL